MKWTGREATLEDCSAVLENLSDITRVGLERAGLTPEEALTVCDEYLNRGHGITVEVDGELAGVFFWHWADYSDLPILETASLWTPLAFGKAGRFAVVACRNQLRRLQAKYSDALITAYSHSPHPDLDRWFRLMGFDRIPVEGGEGRLFAFRG